jgi:hypothetical protein
MAQETLALTATTAPDNWTLGAGASKVAAVALPDDADTSYISAAVNNTEQKFQVAAPVVVTANDLINFVRIVTVARSTSTLASYFTKLFYSAGTSTGATRTNVPTSYTTLNDDYALAPDGGAWTLTKLQSLFASIRMAANRDMRVTSLYVVVDYTAGQNVSASEGAPGTITASASASVSAGETGAGTDAQSVTASITVGEQGIPAEVVAVSASVFVAEAGAGLDAASVSATVSASEQGAGTEAQSVSAAVSAGEVGAGAEAVELQVSASASEQGCGSEGVTVAAEVSVAEQGAGLEGFGVAAFIVMGEVGAGYETISVTVHNTFTLHGAARVSNESGQTHVAAAPNSTASLLESKGRTRAEV